MKRKQPRRKSIGSLSSSDAFALIRAGFVLPLVFGVLALLSFLAMGMMSSSVHNAQTTKVMLQQRKAFFVADDLCRVLGVLGNQYFSEGEYLEIDASCTGDESCDFENFITSNLRGGPDLMRYTPEGYTSTLRIESVDAADGEASPLPSGPFKSMLAKQHRVKYSLSIVHDETGSVAECGQELVIAPVGMFQFYVFSDIYLDLDPGGPVDARGRIHTNGDFCVAGQPRIDTVTSAGRVLISNPNSHGLCRQANGAGNFIQVATDSSFSSFTVLDLDHTHPNWLVESRARFGTHVMDQAHGIEPLNMPVQGIPLVQSGANVLAMEQTSAASDLSETVPNAASEEKNQDTLRFLVDPLLQEDPDDIAEQKFAYKADIRILDGVWYVRNPDAPNELGTPVWSDHPGEGHDRYIGYPTMLRDSEQVGQETLRGALGWSTTPKRYSYYPFRAEGVGLAGEQLFVHDRTSTDPAAVISYGVLHRQLDGTVPFWRPGTVQFDNPGTSGEEAATTLAISSVDLMGAARSGFKNGWLEVRSETLENPDTGDGASALEKKRAKILPVNFDVAAFIEAMQTCTGNEIGSYFPGNCSDFADTSERKFNGIVWIGFTWPGQMDGMAQVAAASTFAKLWPFQDNEPGFADDGMNQSPPMPLCFGQNDTARLVDDPAASNPIFALTGKYTGPIPPVTALDVAAAEAASTFPKCQDISRSQNAAFPNFIRVVNARHINPVTDQNIGGVTVRANAMPGGLTIASHLPMAVVGDANIDTTPRTLRTSPVTDDDHFVPFLVASDRFHRHSNAWEDWRANWQEPMKKRGGSSLVEFYRRRQATSTTQYLEILAGWNPTPAAGGHAHSSDGFEDFPRYNERWSCASPSATATFYGSIVVGFASVFERSGANNGHGSGSYTTCFPNRQEGYDFHLEDPAVQPPGTPRLTAQSVAVWRSE